MICKRNDGPKPEGLIVSDNLLGKVGLYWDFYPSADRYTIYRDGDIIATDVKTNAYEDYDVEPNVIYEYQVQALFGPCGSELSNPASGSSDPDGYSFFATCVCDSSKNVEIGLDTPFKIDWGDGTWVEYSPGYAVGIPFNPDSIVKIQTGFQEGAIQEPNFIRFREIENEAKFIDIAIIWADTLTSAFYMCKDLDALTTFNWFGPCNITNFSNAWNNCTSLINHNFHEMDFSSGTNFNYTWSNNTSLINFFDINLESATTLTATWFNCTGLQNFDYFGSHLDNVETLNFTWAGCTGIINFPYFDSKNVKDFYGTWAGCSSIINFPILDFSSAERFEGTWKDCISLQTYDDTVITVPESGNVSNFRQTWEGCTSLTKLPLFDTSSGVDFTRSWYNTGIEYFPNLSFVSAKYFVESWAFSKIKSMINIESTVPDQMFHGAFNSCTELLCLQGIDTTNADFTDNPIPGIFDGCNNLIRPDADEITQIVNSPGLNWDNESPCPITAKFFCTIEVHNPNVPILFTNSHEITIDDNGYIVDLPAGENTWTSEDGVNTTYKLSSELDLTSIVFNSTNQDANSNYKSIVLSTFNITTIEDICKNLDSLEQVNIDFKQKTCTNFQDAFNNCSGSISVNHTDIVTNWDRAFKDTTFSTINIDVQSGTTYTECFMGNQNLSHLPLLETENCTTILGFENMFKDSGIVCFSGINTSQIPEGEVIQGMFDNCNNLILPDEYDQYLIINGVNWSTDNCPPNRPYPPENLRASKDRWDGVLLTWDAPPTGADYYNIYRDEDYEVAINIQDLEYLDTTAMEGQIHTYYCYAYKIETPNDLMSDRSNFAQGNKIIVELDRELIFNSTTMSEFIHRYKSHITAEGTLNSEYEC